MQTFMVGGAVRDLVLGRTPKDIDYVVVGSTVEQMLAEGFTQVGRDFPVFLHPVTKDEYALARTERRTGVGHTAFEVHAEPTVTLVEDLRRRDFTMNAMAYCEADGLIDPFNGHDDIEAGVIRHVSSAFEEDPLRVLRAARFAARYNFTVHPTTMQYMRDMVARGDLDSLTPERVFKELNAALAGPTPSIFLRVLRECGALRVVLPEVDELYGIPQHEQWHPEVDTGIHTEMVVDMAARMVPGDARIAFAALTHDLGKGITPKHELPSHRGHETTGVPLVEVVCDRLKVPTSYRDLATTVCYEHLNIHRQDEMRSVKLHDKLAAMSNGFKIRSMVEDVLTVCEADKRGRLGLTEEPYPQRAAVLSAFDAAAAVRVADLPETRHPRVGEQIGKDLRRARSAAISAARKTEEATS